MWKFIKFILGLWVLFILLMAMAQYFNNYSECNDKGGDYNISDKGFECQGEDK